MTTTRVNWPAVSAGSSNWAYDFTPRVPLGNPWGAPVGQDTNRIRVAIRMPARDMLDTLREQRGKWVRIETDHGPMLVTGASCGLDCYCDAVAIPLSTPTALRPKTH